MIAEIPEQDIRQAASLIRSAQHAVVLTGAGISTPSGVPDFRSKNTGLWTQTNPMETASLTTFQRRPERFFDWLRPLVGTILAAKPNPAHIALAELEKAGRIQAVITQNIDGLHQAAGSRTVIELHGTLATLTCPRCHSHYELGEYAAAFIESASIPRCRACATILKPDIVLFEEMLPASAWELAEQHCSQADLIWVVGSSLEVMPANSLPWIAVERGAQVIITNLTPTHLDGQADLLFPYDAAEVLPRMAAEII